MQRGPEIREGLGGGRSASSILDSGLVQDRSEILGVGGVVALVRVGRSLVSNRAEEDHAGDQAEQLQEADDEAHRAYHVQPGDQPHLNGGGAALLVPEFLVAALRV